MKTRALIGASLAGLVALTSAGWSCGGPCPDLEVACPDLNCPNGYKVDHNSCAICECVGDVDPEPVSCLDDADCPRGFVCQFPDGDFLMEPCAQGFEDCGMPRMAGTCVEIEQPRDCAELDEQACIAAENCEPLYAYPATDEPSADCWDCGGTGGGFVGCVERYEPSCSTDRECGPGYMCMNGTCVWVEQPYDCYSDYDCPEGYYCEFYWDQPQPGADGEADQAAMRAGGYCMPREEQRCENLGEWECIERPDCEPVYADPMCDCIDCPCAMEAQFIYCQETNYGGECYSDYDCPDGMICVFPGWDCADGTDCGMPYYEGGRCVEDQPPPATCYSDYDCDEGYHCEYARAEPQPDCAEGENCDAIAPAMGVCVPDERPYECYSDYDCPEGFFCALDGGRAPCDPATGSDCTAEYYPGGVCLPSEPSDGCTSDRDCPEGTYCEVQVREYCEVTASGEVVCYAEQGAGVCLPIQTPDECREDADCPNGYCEYYATCDAIGCPPAPPSQCVYPACRGDGSEAMCDMMPPTCAPGETVVVMDGCYACVDARTCEQPPPPAYCYSDADCGDNAYCAYDQACGGEAPNPDDPTGERPIRACGICVER